MKNVISDRKKLLGLVVLVLAIPLTIFLVNKVQDLRQRAAGGANATITMPAALSVDLNQNINIPISINTDGADVRGVDVSLNFDKTKLQVVSITPDAASSTSFKQFAPIVSSAGAFDSASVVAAANLAGKIEFSAVTFDWAGNVLTGAYNGTTLLATVTVKGIVDGVTPIAFNFTPGLTIDTNLVSDSNPPQDLLTQVGQLTNLNLTVGTITPTTVVPTNTSIPPTSTPTSIQPTNTPTNTPTPAVTDTPVPTNTQIPTNTPIPQATTLQFNVKLHGIGNGGDTPNPNSTGNFSPVNSQRNLSVDLYLATTNTLVANTTGVITFNQQSGIFTGNISVPGSVGTNFYNLRIKSDRYLIGQLLGVSITSSSQQNPIPVVALVAGDINNDSSLDILDYNQLVSCYGSPDSQIPNCANSTAPDIYDDGNVDFIDLNLWLREFSKKS